MKLTNGQTDEWTNEWMEYVPPDIFLYVEGIINQMHAELFLIFEIFDVTNLN